MGNSCIKSNKKVHTSIQTEENTKDNDYYNHKGDLKQKKFDINYPVKRCFLNQKKINREFYLSKLILNNNLNNRDVIIDWEAKNKTVKYHWWPMLYKGKNDYINNLYAIGGGLDKYDNLFGTKSIELQREYYMIPIDSTRNDKKWAGFCNNASILSCLYEYPKYPVTVSYNNKENLFTQKDIEALMIICSDNAVQDNLTLFFGKRNNELEGDDDLEPYPSQFLKMLNIMCMDDEPFVMDIDNGVSVWNYAYDKVIVEKHQNCYIEHSVPTEGDNVFYNFKIFSEAYPKKNQDLWGYINTQTVSNGFGCIETKKIKEGWINIKHPDFLWKKFKKETAWIGRSKINSEIVSSIVYRIYIQSLNKYNIKLVIQ